MADKFIFILITCLPDIDIIRRSYMFITSGSYTVKTSDHHTVHPGEMISEKMKIL